MTVECPTSIDPETTTAFAWPRFLRQSLIAYGVMWLGITLAGGVFGAAFLLIGAIFGVIFAGLAGAATSLVGVLLHVAMRGRLPLRVSAIFAGATAGILSWGVIGFLENGEFKLPRDIAPFCLITAPMGSLGAVIATSLLLRAFRKQEIGRPLRLGQFSLADLMLFTAWLAVVMTACRLIIEPASPGSYRDPIFAAITLFAMGVTEGLYQLRRWLFHRLHEEPLESTNESDLRAFWRQHDKQMEEFANREATESAERSP